MDKSGHNEPQMGTDETQISELKSFVFHLCPSVAEKL
jgi:hypothetical protein